MKHPFSVLQAEYVRDLQAMQVRSERVLDIDGVARKLLRFKPRYAPVASETGVPIPIIATLHQRESGANFSTYLGNGEPLGRVTKLVPKGRGPWPSWESGAIDAIKYDHLNDISVDAWTLPYACWKSESWNGFGPRNRGKRTGYLWAGTNLYTGGKYVADGVWNPNAQDRQLGVVPVMLRMIELDPSLQFGTVVYVGITPSIVPEPLAAPLGVGAGTDGKWNAAEIQQALNVLGFGPLVVDGSYGRRTREAVRSFQRAHGLTADGLAGTKETIPALEAAVAASA